MRNLLRQFFVVACGVLFLGIAYAAKVQFVSQPPGATVQLTGPDEYVKRLKVAGGTTPFELDLSRSVNFQVSFSKPGFESVQVAVVPKDLPTVTITLQPLLVERSVMIESNPPGAEVLQDGATIGTTPFTKSFSFSRASSKDPWKIIALQFKKNEYQSDDSQLVLNSNLQTTAKLSLTLDRIAEDRAIEVLAVDEQAKPIPHAEIFVNDAPKGTANDKGAGQVVLPFRRANRTAAWPDFKVVVAVKNEYQPVARKVAVNDPLRQEFRLSPVTEVLVRRYFPATEMTPRGPRIMVDPMEVLGILDQRDLNSPATDTRLVTNFDRRQPTVKAVSSFTLTPDGKSIIYSVTADAGEGRFYSNLFLKGVQAANSPTTTLTQGTRYLDCYPVMSGEEGSTLAVFQSNRGVPDTWDISAVRVDGSRIVGGIQQLTRDPRFNYGPVLATEQHPVFFSSIEEMPRSPARISSVRADGSTFTSHGEIGEMLCYSSSGMLYFSRTDAQSGKMQIFSLSVDGQVLSTVLNAEQFAKSNCTWPMLSPTSDRLLFVSDDAQDEKGRKNNNIFVYDLRSGKVDQLTHNGSDDIMPRWSPTEPGVIYFLSNRQGIYNVWRMTFRLAQ